VARALVAAGVEVHESTVAGLVVGLAVGSEDRRAELGLGGLRRVLALAPVAEHPARIAAWAAAVVAGLRGQRPEGEVRERLVPRLLAEADPRLWTRALAPGLHLAVAEDLPARQRLLSPFDLPRLGLGMAEAQACAMANLRARTPPPLVEDGVFTWAVGDGLDAARLLLAGSWQQGALGALGVVPARDLCWWLPVTGPADLERGVALALRARELGSLPYPLSSTLWWVPSGEGELAPVPLHREGGPGGDEGGAVRVSVPEELARRLAR